MSPKKKYGRIKDIEDFKIHPEDKKVKSHNWANGQKYDKCQPKHYTRNYDFDKLKWIIINEKKSNNLKGSKDWEKSKDFSKRWILFISTWNHMFEKSVDKMKDYEKTECKFTHSFKK